MNAFRKRFSEKAADVSKGIRIGTWIGIALCAFAGAATYGAATFWALPSVQSWSGVSASAWNDIVSHVNQIANRPGLRIKKAYTPLVTGIAYHTTTPTNTYAIPVTLPADTKAVILSVRYLHWGGADHGYLSFNAYQQNATAADDKAFTTNYHYNDYYNSDYQEIIVPWNNTGNGNSVTIQVTDSYNTNGNNTYNIYYAGYIAGS